MIETDCYARDWFGLDWSEWKPLDVDSFAEIPKAPDLYRVRHRRESRPFLEYIGESGDTRRRVQSLARGIYADEMPYRDPHTAALCLWAVRDAVGPALEFSHVTPHKAADDQHRKGSEAALIALHRRETNQSLTGNFGRIMRVTSSLYTAITTPHTRVVVSMTGRAKRIQNRVSPHRPGRIGETHVQTTGWGWTGHNRIDYGTVSMQIYRRTVSIGSGTIPRRHL